MLGPKIAFLVVAASLVSACAAYSPSPAPSLAETQAVLTEVGGTKLAPPRNIVVLPRSDFANRFGVVAKGAYDPATKIVYLPDDWRYGGGLATLAQELKQYADDVNRIPGDGCGARRAAADFAAARDWNATARREIDDGMKSGCARLLVDSGYDRFWAARSGDRPGIAASGSPGQNAMPASAQPAPSHGAAAGYWVEYAAYLSPDYANHLVERLDSMGIETRVVSAQGAGGRQYYRVRSPSGVSRDAAGNAAVKVGEALHIVPLVHRDGHPQSVALTDAAHGQF